MCAYIVFQCFVLIGSGHESSAIRKQNAVGFRYIGTHSATTADPNNERTIARQ